MALACLPLIAGGGVVGGLAAVFDEPRSFEPNERSFLMVFAGHCAQALDRLRVQVTERIARDRLVRLQEVTSALSAAATVDQVSTVATRFSTEALGATSGALYGLSASGELKLLAAFGSRSGAAASQGVAPNVGIAARALRSQTPVWEEPRGQDEPPSEPTGETVVARAALPLLVDGRSAGVITFSYAKLSRFSGDERVFIQTMAHQCAQAMDRARLLDAEQRTARRLTRLQEVTSALSRAATPADVANVAVQQGASVLRAVFTIFYVLDGDNLTILEHRNVPAGAVEEYGSVPLSEHVPATMCLRARHPVWVQSVEQFQRDFPALAERVSRTYRIPSLAIACLPLISGDRGLGTLLYAFSDDHFFDAEERSLMQLMSDQCAQAFERARLFDEARTREADLRRSADNLVRQKRAAEISQARLGRMFDSNLIGNVTWSIGGLITGANEAFLSMVGYTRSELDRGLIDWRELTPPEFLERDEAAMERLQQEGMHPPYEKDYFRKDGSRVPLLVASAFFPDSREEGISYVVDLSGVKSAETETKRLYDAERAARAEAEAANRIKDEFLATVSHELRTPLNAITGWVQLLGTGRLPPERAAHAIRVIERNARVQEQLIADLLDVSRVISGRLRLNVEPVRLSDVIGMAVEAVRPLATEKSVRISTKLEDEVPDVTGDADRLQQVVWNLLTNAVKFTPEGGSVEVRLEAAMPHVSVAVRDTGQGIKQEFLPYVFEPFSQADSSFARAHRGLGLGLAITRTLVEMHGGVIEAFSEGPSRGATFTVRLPAATMRPEATERVPVLSRPMHAPPESGRLLQDLRILVVEDEPDSRELLVSLLDQHGAKVMAAASAAEALERFKHTIPRVLLSDLGLPGEDGLSLIQKVRRLPDGKRLAAVALTAFVRSEDRFRAVEAGFDAHLAKPIDPDRLIELLVSLSSADSPSRPEPPLPLEVSNEH